MNILALDVGSSSVKAAYWHAGRFGDTARIAFPTLHDGLRVEVPPAAILRAVDEALAVASRGQPAPDAIAFDTFSSGVAVLDPRTGKARCNIITHQYRRSLEDARRIEAAIGKRKHLTLAGNRPVPGGIGSTSLAWLAAHDKAAFRGGALVGQTSSLVLRHLTGEWVIDPSQATFLGLCDIRKGAWHEELCAAAGVKSAWLPRVAYADEIAGRLTAPAGRRTKLPAGAPVIGGLIDTGAAVVATGMPVGQLVHNAGSTDVLALCITTPQPDEDILTRPVGTGAALPARWLAASTIAAAGSAIDWAHQMFFRDLSKHDYRALVARTCHLAAHRGAGWPRHAGLVSRQDARVTSEVKAGRMPALLGSAANSTLVFTPYLAGDRTSLDQPTAALTGLTLATSREDMLAALVAGLIAESGRRYARLSQLEPILPVVRTMGGAGELAGAMHSVWPQAHRFRAIDGEALAGLVVIAKAALGG